MLASVLGVLRTALVFAHEGGCCVDPRLWAILIPTSIPPLPLSLPFHSRAQLEGMEGLLFFTPTNSGAAIPHRFSTCLVLCLVSSCLLRCSCSLSGVSKETTRPVCLEGITGTVSERRAYVHDHRAERSGYCAETKMNETREIQNDR